jgi:hypothetical protein
VNEVKWTTKNEPNFRQRPDYSGFKRFDFDPFDEFFGPGGSAKFHFNFNEATLFHKQTITSR